MIIFCNLQNVAINEKKLTPVAVLKLTTAKGLKLSTLPLNQKKSLSRLIQEAKKNGFGVQINNKFVI